MKQYVYTALIIAAGIAAATLVRKFFGIGTTTTTTTSS